MNKHQIIIITTTQYRINESVRPKQAIEMFSRAVRRGYHVVDVDDSDSQVRNSLQSTGAHIYPQSFPGKGPARRQGFFLAHEFARHKSMHSPLFLWVDAEKADVVDHAEKIAAPINGGDCCVVMAKRSPESWSSWPNYQVETEQSANKHFGTVTGWHDFDPMFGCAAFHLSVVPEIINFHPRNYFLKSNGHPPVTFADEYIQTLAAIEIWARAGQRPVQVEVDVSYPVEQRQEEEGPLLLQMRAKRTHQRNTMMDAFGLLARAHDLPRHVHDDKSIKLQAYLHG